MTQAQVPSLALDTCVFSLLRTGRGRHAEFASLVRGHAIALPFPVVGELKAGAIRAAWGVKPRKALDTAIRRCTVIPSDTRVVDQWAELSARFVGRLKAGGVNDMWIAACCVVHGLPLATANLSDFETIAGEFPGLQIVHPDLP